MEVACLPERNLVFVVDDDAMMLRSVARLLRQLGYASVLFPSAEAFVNHSDFDGVVSSFSTSTWAYQAKAPSQRSEHVCAGHLHHRERQRGRSDGCASIRVPCLSHKAIFGEVADGAAT